MIANVAQLVERNLAKVDVVGSNPIIRFFYATVAQLVERQPEELGVGGSTPSGGIAWVRDRATGGTIYPQATTQVTQVV
jgi:hypothetical protein